MKKLYTLLFVAFAATVNAQVVNGDLEIWTDATTLEGFTPVTSGTFSANNFLSQESTIKHGGNYSAGHTSQAGTQTFEATLIPIVVGTTYTMKYWYLDNDPSARSRNWCTWVTSDGTTVTAINVDDALLHDTTYTVDAPEWVEKSVTVTAPVGATHFRFQVRTYKETATAIGGKLYYDDLTFTAALSVKQNSIAGLKVYPNPVTNGTLFISTDNNTTKSVAVYDVVGKQVINTVATSSVNVSSLKSGVYMVKITEDGKTGTRKIVIQ